MKWMDGGWMDGVIMSGAVISCWYQKYGTSPTDRNVSMIVEDQSPLCHRSSGTLQMGLKAFSSLTLTIFNEDKDKPGITTSLNAMFGRVPQIQWFPDLVG